MYTNENTGGTLDFLSQPWLAKEMAARAEAPGNLDERLEILFRLAGLPLKQQVVSICRCAGRDIIVATLLRRGEYGVVLSLLQSELARWLPDPGEFADLKWLLETLLSVKRQGKGKKTRVVLQTPDGPRVSESAAMLEALLDESVAAAAGAWVRCLCGPGGDHRVWEMPAPLTDQEMVEAIGDELAVNPRALALLLEELPPGIPGRLLTSETMAELMPRGLQAAQFCLQTIETGLKKFSSSGINEVQIIKELK